MPSTSSHSAPKNRKPVLSAIILEKGQPIPLQRMVRSTRNYSDQLKKLKKGQCYRIKDHDLFMRMRAAAHTQNSKHAAGYICRWIGPFGRIWNASGPATKSAKR